MASPLYLFQFLIHSRDTWKVEGVKEEKQLDKYCRCVIALLFLKIIRLTKTVLLKKIIIVHVLIETANPLPKLPKLKK